jgi:hypothetical protein
MTRALRSRLQKLEHARKAGGVTVLIQPADLTGEALAEWERANLPACDDRGLTVILRRFGASGPAPQPQRRETDGSTRMG